SVSGPGKAGAAPGFRARGEHSKRETTMGRQRHTAIRTHAAAAAFLVAALQAGCERAPGTDEAGMQGMQAADGAELAPNGAITSASGNAKAEFDLVLTEVRREGDDLVFVERV